MTPYAEFCLMVSVIMCFVMLGIVLYHEVYLPRCQAQS